VSTLPACWTNRAQERILRRRQLNSLPLNLEQRERSIDFHLAGAEDARSGDGWQCRWATRRRAKKFALLKGLVT